MDSFPFTFNPVHGGFSAVEGVCLCEDEGIVCEFQVDIAGLGLKTGVKEARLSYDDMESCDYRRGWFGGRVVIGVRGLRPLNPFPSHQNNELVFRIRRRDRKRAELVATEIDLRRASRRRSLLLAEGE